MERIDKLLDLVEKGMKTAGSVALMGMAAITVLDVVLRYFGKPVFGSEEMVMFLGTLVIGFTLPYAHKQKSHIGVEIFIRLFSERVKKVLFLITDIVTAAFFILVAVRLFIHADKERLAKTVSLNLEFPEYLIIYILSFCFLVFVFFIIRDIAAKSREEN